MNLRQLGYFIKIVEQENMTRAAAQLHLAQTALGIQIKNLEAELGVKLIERHSRGVKITLAGNVLYEHATKILHDVEVATNEVRLSGGAEGEPINFGVPSSILRLLGSKLQTLAREEVPDASILITEELSFKLVSALQREELDFALVFDINPAAGIVRTALLEERLFFITPANDPKDGQPISFEETLLSDLALVSDRDIIWNVVHETADHLSRDVRVAFEVQSTSAIKTLVERNAATSIMPYGIIADELKMGTLSARPIDNSRIVRTLYLAKPANAFANSLDPFTQCLVPKLVDLYAERLGRHVNMLIKNDDD